jgi:hypothetical protein
MLEHKVNDGLISYRSRTRKGIKRKHPPRRLDAPCYIYFARCQRFVKIGYAADPYKRIHSMQSGCPYPITLLSFVEGSPIEERAMHSRFRPIHRQAEWFEERGELAQLVRALRDHQGDPAERRDFLHEWWLATFKTNEMKPIRIDGIAMEDIDR